MKQWQQLFTKVILERGEDYFQRDLVKNLRKNKTGYEAEVEGTDIYDVEISMHDGEVSEMDCDCPYADKGYNCKHMAAVLYAIDEVTTSKEDIADFIHEQTKLFEILNKLSKEELQNIILKFADDKYMKNYIFLHFAPKIKPKHIEVLKEQFWDIIQDILPKKNSYSEFSERAHNFMEENMYLLLKRQAYIEAFDLSQAIFLMVADLPMPVSDEAKINIYEQCRKYWSLILDESKHGEQEVIFVWLMEQLVKQDPQDYLEYIPKLIFDMLTSSFAEEKYQQVYWEYPLIRRILIHELIQSGEIDGAIDILKESKKLDKDDISLVSAYSKQLMKLYLNTGKIIKYKQETLFYARHCYKQTKKISLDD